MADCYYHGQSAPGPCPQCEKEKKTSDKEINKIISGAQVSLYYRQQSINKNK
jgi:hypothetical protein